MKIQILILTFYSIINLSLQQERNLYFLPSTSRARCIDGTQPGFYFSKGYGNGSNKFFIFLEGGAMCTGNTIQQFLESCYVRSKTQLGSSNLWPINQDFSSFLYQPSQNNVMYNWNQIFMKYCDGFLYQGSSDPIQYKDQNLYFRGYDNMVELFKFLIENFGLNKADAVVLGGGSAGGLGAISWNQYLRQLLPSNIKMVVVPDSSIFPLIITNPALQAEILDLITNNKRELIQPQGCSYINDNRNAYKCLSLQHITELMGAPLFIINSLYDEFSLVCLLGVKCVTSTHGLDKCNALDVLKIIWLKKNILNQLHKIKELKPDWGFWGISCVLHVFFADQNTYSNGSYSVPQYGGLTVSQSLSNFIDYHTNSESIQKNNFYHIDQIDYPKNIACNGLIIQQS